jgi:hypothetical protein
MSVTGPVPVTPVRDTVEIEELQQQAQPQQQAPAAQAPMLLMPVPAQPPAQDPGAALGVQPTQQNEKQSGRGE